MRQRKELVAAGVLVGAVVLAALGMWCAVEWADGSDSASLATTGREARQGYVVTGSDSASLATQDRSDFAKPAAKDPEARQGYVVTGSDSASLASTGRETRQGYVVGPGRAGQAVLAGSGAVLPVMEMLVQEHVAAGGGELRVAPSIGSGGGLKALRDGAVAAALMSREPKDGELPPGARAVRFCLAPVVLAAGLEVPEPSLSAAQLAALVRGERVTWSNGAAAWVILREAGDSATAVFGQAFPAFRDAQLGALEQGTWRVALSDAAMEQALASSLSAVGVFDLGTLRMHAPRLKVVAVEGCGADGRGCPRRPFLLVVPADPDPAVVGLVEFVCGAEGRALLESFGYEPVECRAVAGGRDA
jgi:phosphate transport system substrate-binding protein